MLSFAVAQRTQEIGIHGSLYPALHRLEARGWIKSKWGASERNRRGKFYTLTASGRRQLKIERETWKRFSTALDSILQMN